MVPYSLRLQNTASDLALDLGKRIYEELDFEEIKANEHKYHTPEGFRVLYDGRTYSTRVVYMSNTILQKKFNSSGM